jgi:hypothetical protein
VCGGECRGRLWEPEPGSRACPGGHLAV